MSLQLLGDLRIPQAMAQIIWARDPSCRGRGPMAGRHVSQDLWTKLLGCHGYGLTVGAQGAISKILFLPCDKEQ